MVQEMRKICRPEWRGAVTGSGENNSVVGPARCVSLDEEISTSEALVEVGFVPGGILGWYTR